MGSIGKIALMLLNTYGQEYRQEPGLIGPERELTCQEKYEPFSLEAKSLFAEVAPLAGVPRSWADNPGLHSILREESNGVVGIPNYSIKDESGRSIRNKPYLWPEIHEKIKQLGKGSSLASSSATGLGQLLAFNAEKYYPSGKQGIGDCREEAIGMLRYIRATYGSPDKAWSCYGKLRPKNCRYKQFREGY